MDKMSCEKVDILVKHFSIGIEDIEDEIHKDVQTSLTYILHTL